MSYDMRDRIAKVIFEQCRDLGIDDTLSEGDTWRMLSQGTREMYQDVAVAVEKRLADDEDSEYHSAKADEKKQEVERLWQVIKESRDKINELSQMEELP